MSEIPPQWLREDKNDASQPERYRLDPARTERGEIVPIDQYLLSIDGRKKMNAFVTEVDDSADIPLTISDIMRRDAANPYAVIRLLLSREGREGLSRKELTNLYRHNPAMNITLQRIQYVKHQGDIVMERLYRDTLTVFANMTRYEALNGMYQPEGAVWDHRADAIPLHKGKSFVQYHPERFGQ